MEKGVSREIQKEMRREREKEEESEEESEEEDGARGGDQPPPRPPRSSSVVGLSRVASQYSTPAKKWSLAKNEAASSRVTTGAALSRRASQSQSPTSSRRSLPATITPGPVTAKPLTATATPSLGLNRKASFTPGTVHYGTKPGHFEASRIHSPTSEGVSEVSKRANK